MGRTLPWDWYPGSIPENVAVDPTAYVETTFSFHRFRSELDPGVSYAPGAATYLATMFDVGPRGSVELGRCVSITGARIIADERIAIGDYTLISWDVVLMDTYRAPLDAGERRRMLRELAARERRVPDPVGDAGPIEIGENVWIGLGVCVLPGVTIGADAVVGARSVVREDVPPGAIVAGNPARVIRVLDQQEREAAAAARRRAADPVAAPAGAP